MMGVGMSPVREISRWHRGTGAAAPGFRGPLDFSLRITARALRAGTATLMTVLLDVTPGGVSRSGHRWTKTASGARELAA